MKPLWLTQEEAAHLLELSVASGVRVNGAEERTLQKLGDLCRAFWREDEPPHEERRR
jgi:hypothetical protein